MNGAGDDVGVDDVDPVTASEPPVLYVGEGVVPEGVSVRVLVLTPGGGNVGYPSVEDDVVLPVTASEPPVEWTPGPLTVTIEVLVKWFDQVIGV